MVRLIMVLTTGLLLAPHVEAQESTEPVEATESTATEATATEAAATEATDAAEATATEAAATEPGATEATDEVGISYVAAEEAPAEVEPDCNGVYCKKVQGTLWIEGTAGPARYNLTKFRAFNLLDEETGQLQPNVIVSGGEYGAALGAQLKVFSIGVRFKYAKLGLFDLITAGLDFGFLVKRTPYVHPYARFGLNYHTTRGGSPIPGLERIDENQKVYGAGASIGAGIRVPVIKWISIAIGFDYSFIALYVTGDVYETFAVGGEIAGTFALTVHPI
jgi:hypothetical protein